MNTKQLAAIAADLARFGVLRYTTREGNGCIWVTYGIHNVSVYYFFNKDDTIRSIQVD